jgi:multidrug efflux pump subunit AcrA (membrane-fusion protein)
VGAAVSPGETVVSMTSDQDMYIEANISEINIGKLTEGNPVSVKFDAFPGEEFRGVVSFIEPGDVIVEGVVNYKIRVNLVGSAATTSEMQSTTLDSRIKNGLTADLKIETSKISDAVTLPLYAVTKEEGKSFVNKILNGKSEMVEIQLGREGSDGMVEVVSGVVEGDSVEF